MGFPHPALPTLWIIGDSTVRNGQDTGNNGQWGWGNPIASYFDQTKINVQNRALGGTSSRTFRNRHRQRRTRSRSELEEFTTIHVQG